MKTKREVIEALDKIVTVLSGEDVTGPCTAKKKSKRGVLEMESTCITRQHDWRGKNGETKGYLNYNPKEMCDACVVYWYADAARVQLWEMSRREEWVKARTAADERVKGNLGTKVTPKQEEEECVHGVAKLFHCVECDDAKAVAEVKAKGAVTS